MGYATIATNRPYIPVTYGFFGPENLGTFWNGTAFEAYNVSHWTTYDLPSAELVPGVYRITLPTISATGYYDVYLYEQLGGTPAVSDPLLATGTVYLTATVTAPTLPQFGGRWRIFSADEVDNPLETLYLTQGDSRYLAFDFSGCREVQKGVTVSTAAVPSISGVTISDVSCSGKLCVALFTGTASGTAYMITITANLSDGTVIKRTRKLLIS